MKTIDIITAVFSNFLTDFIKKFFSILKNEHPVQQPTMTLIEPEILQEYESSLRLRKCVELLNKGLHESDKYPHSRFAEILELEKVSDFSDLIDSKSEPTIALLNRFSLLFNINQEWLLHGQKNPFSHMCIAVSNLTDAIPIMYEYDPERIYFIRSRTEDSICCVVLKKSNWEYKILHYWGNWKISNKTGGTGQGQTTSIYETVMSFKNGFYTYKNSRTIKEVCLGISKICGVELETDDEVYDIIYGKKHCNFLDSHLLRNQACYWWDDLTDLNHNVFTREQYLNTYGQSFLQAQEVIRYKLNKHSIR